jgi:hypothetical protein
VNHWEIFEAVSGVSFDIVVAKTAADAIRSCKASLPPDARQIDLIARPSKFDPADPEAYEAPRAAA